ncbi:hypothetical protein [Streptomyces sp. NPDC007088]|uniref:hypothetical protein n=1 Tax=Streptomyces sp. NPDC007088 TaxID=3364773 RepID=UPI00368E44F9
MTEVFLRRLSRWQAETQREAMADLYVEAYQGAPGEVFHDRQGFLNRYAEDVQRTGFEMVIAGAAELGGCAYGYTVDRAGTWWQGFTGAHPEAEELTAAGQVFLVAELMVRPGERRAHVATRLLELLLTRTETAWAVAGVPAHAFPAHHAFTSWGWTTLGRLDPAPASATGALDVWGRRRAR